MSRVACVLFAALVGFASFPRRTQAQVSSPMTPETAYPVSLVSPDSAAGTAINPSSLGALSNWSLSYSHVAAARDTNQRDKYDGAWFATPVGKAMALGTGIEFARARDGSLANQNGFVLASAINAG